MVDVSRQSGVWRMNYMFVLNNTNTNYLHTTHYTHADMYDCTLYSTYSLLNGEFITLYFHFYAMLFTFQNIFTIKYLYPYPAFQQYID